MEEVTLEFFKRIQELISRSVAVEHLEVDSSTILGALDVSYSNGVAFCGAVVWRLSEEVPLKKVVQSAPVNYPYVPGLLYVREGPIMFSTVRSLDPKPSVLLIDGHGLAHPRRAGLASMVGVLADVPTIGVAKHILFGDVVRHNERELIFVDDEPVGIVCTGDDGRTFYASIGHRVDMTTIIDLLEISGWRYPPHLSEAHSLARSAAVSAERSERA
ncbi:MAG: endonuclease V [Aigarchaeota archaeon]|nr:endonuclease V [Aigarchaeota archaeon]MDW8093308.1 endonuclease V [Nitrososphaerota archaeon]